MQVSLLGFRSIFSQEIDFEDLGEEDFAPAPPSSHIHDPAPQVPHNNLDDPPNHPTLDLYFATFVALLLALQALDTEIRIVPHVSVLGGRVVWRQLQVFPSQQLLFRLLKDSPSLS